MDPVPQEPRLTTVADWQDVDAAVAAAVSRHELALLRVERPGPLRRVYHLVGARGEPGSIAVRRPDGPGPDPTTIIVEASVGRVQDDSRASRLVADIVFRLGQLRGEGVAAPLPPGW